MSIYNHILNNDPRYKAAMATAHKTGCPMQGLEWHKESLIVRVLNFFRKGR